MRTPAGLAVVLFASAVAALAQGPPRPTPSEPPAEPPPLECPIPTGAAAAYDWTGLYDAAEGVAPTDDGPSMVMGYKFYVFRESDRRWRAYSWVSGQTTYQQWALCGVAGARTLTFEGRNARPDPDADPEEPTRLFTLARSPRGKFSLRVEGGSYLLNEPSIDATREPLPPWAGSYAYDSCAGAAKAPPCWRYAIDVTLRDDGWRALVVAGPADAPRRMLARGEDYEIVTDGGKDVLDLTFLRPPPGEPPPADGPKAGDAMGRITRAKDGALTLELQALPGPPDRKQVPLARVTPVTAPAPKARTK